MQPPQIEISVVDLPIAVAICREAGASAAECLSPHDVVGAIDDAIAVVIAGQLHVYQLARHENAVEGGKVGPKHNFTGVTELAAMPTTIGTEADESQSRHRLKIARRD